MNKGITFSIGFIVGGIIGVLGSKTYFEKKYQKITDDTIADMEDYYQRTDEYARKLTELTEEEVEALTADRRTRKESIRKNSSKSEKTDYTKYYKSEDRDEKDDEEEGPTPEDEANEYHEKNKNRKPRIISVEALGELPAHYEEEALIYYTLDDTLVGEDDEVIENVEMTVGDCLTKYDFAHSEEQIIFVQNFALDKVYEITKCEMSYTEIMNREYGSPN